MSELNLDRVFIESEILKMIEEELKDEFTSNHRAAMNCLRAQKGCDEATRKVLCRMAMMFFNSTHEAHRALLVLEESNV